MPKVNLHFLPVILLLVVIGLISIIGMRSQPSSVPPYPEISMISGVEWDFTSSQTSISQNVAEGSDLWSITWADDDALYTGWGDGGGFGGTNSDGRVKLGVGRVAGTPENLQASNIFGGKNAATAAIFEGKPSGILSVDGTLYMGVTEQDAWLRLKIGRSTDHGLTWVFNSTDWSSDAGWDFAEADGAFSDVTFLQFGQDYAGARDNYVYAYSQDKRVNAKSYDIAMFRVPKDQIIDRSAYEYFAGLDGNNNPQWTTDISQRQAVFSDPNGVGWGSRVVYNAGLKRYLLTTWHAEDGSWGIFDAPEPWGPWTTVAYYDQWQGSTFKFGFAFPNKWTSVDGKSFVMVFSGVNAYDDWNTLKGRFVMAGSMGK